MDDSANVSFGTDSPFAGGGERKRRKEEREVFEEVTRLRKKKKKKGMRRTERARPPPLPKRQVRGWIRHLLSPAQKGREEEEGFLFLILSHLLLMPDAFGQDN